MDAHRRRWALGTIGALVAVCAAALVYAGLAGPADPTGYGPEAERVIVDACTRARGGRGEDGCRCAYQRLETEIPWPQAVELDRELGPGGRLPDEVAALVRGCWDVTSSA